jgi:lipopolysaccharide transport system permease protein
LGTKPLQKQRRQDERMAEQGTVVTIDAPGDGLTAICPPSGQLSWGLAEFWKYRNLVYLFVWRDTKVRYKQTVLGADWAFLQPFLTMVVFTLVFGRLAKVPSGGVAYPVFVLSGLLPLAVLCSRAGSVRQQPGSRAVPADVSAVLGGLPDFGVAFTVCSG